MKPSRVWQLRSFFPALVLLLSLSSTESGAEEAEEPQHVMVYDEPGRFAAWPANGGLWSWDGGQELVVTFEVGWFRDKPDHEDGHARDERSCDDYLARSLDGGLTWAWSEYSQFGGGGEYAELKKPMPFQEEGFAFKSQGERFYFTTDRGHAWSGPFRLAVWGVLGKFEARTDYMITGERSGLFFVAVEPDGTQERALVAETTDGGLSFDLRGWIADSQPAQHERWVMPSVVRIGTEHLVAAVRRKDNRALRNWIDLYDSHDNGRTWSVVGKIADTATEGEPFNGNPPALVRLDDGRLVVTYGVRAKPYRIAARASLDDGRSWSPEITLRGGARNWDIGYPKTIVRADGKLVTVYYFATPDNRDQFIAATIWDPDTEFSIRGVQ